MHAIWTWLGVMLLWTGGLLVVAWLADLALRRVAAPGLRMVLYAVVIVRVALPVDWHTPVGVLDEGRATVEVSRAVVDASATAEPFVVATEGTASASIAAPAIDAAALGLLALYAVVAIALLGVFLRRLRPLRAVLAESTAVRMYRGVPVRVHADAGPMAIGVWRPTIVVPEAMLTSLAPELLDAVLRHEHAHVRHRDGASAIVLALVCVVAWPLVPVWIAVARIRLLMELRADAAAVQSCDTPAVRGYRRLLLELAEHRAPVHVLAPGLDPVAALRARLRAMASRSRVPWLLQLAFVGPLAAVLLVGAARRSKVDDEPTPARAEPFAVAGFVPLYPHCREHEGKIEVPIVDPVAEARDRAKLEAAAKAIASPSPDRVGLLDGIAASLLEGPQQIRNAPRVEARFLLGLRHAEDGRMDAAAHHLGEAAWEASWLDYDLLAAESAAALVVVHLRRGAPAEARAWSDHAEAARRRARMAGPMAIEMHRALTTLDEDDGQTQAAAFRRKIADALDDACEVVAR